MEGPPVRSLALSGAGYSLDKTRASRPIRQVKTARAAPTDSASREHQLAPKITTVDALVRELRRVIHAMFCTVDPSIPSANAYENYSRQAFRFFTTTNSITSECFQHKVVRLGLHASPPRLAKELFSRIDQNDLGEIDYATFAQRVFLPESFYAPDEHSQAPGAALSSKQISGYDPTRRASIDSPAAFAGENNLSLPRQGPPAYEHMQLDELEKRLARTLRDKFPRSTDSAGQAFRLFTSANAITFAEFHRQLGDLQILLSPAKCRELFVRIDRDRDGAIDFIEFVATFFTKVEASGRPGSARSSRSSIGDRGAGDPGSSITTKHLVAMLRERMDHFSEETDRFQQAFRIFGKPSGISRYEFNSAMKNLGLKISEKQMQDLFDTFDFDKTGDLDVNKFVQGVMLDDNSTSSWLSVKDRQKVEDSRRKLYSMAVQSVQESWTIADIERMLREKIEQRTSRSSDCFRQAFRIFKKVNGIKPDEFHAALEAIGLAMPRPQSDILFRRFDKDGSGDIDLNEFIHGILPPDYTGISWVAAADEMHRIAAQNKKAEALANPEQYMTEIEMESWSLDEIEKRIRDKIQQTTSRSSDTFRQAYKIFKKASHVTMDEFRERLLALGFRLTQAQCEGLFRRYDTDNSNDLDLQEFCMKILPPDYTHDGDHWSHTEKYKKERHRQKLEYVKRSKNGLIVLPKFVESHRFTRGHHVSHTFEEMQEGMNRTFDNHSDISSNNGDTPRPMTPSTQEDPARPPTPRTPRTSRAPLVSATDGNVVQQLSSPRSNNFEIHSPKATASPRMTCSPRRIRAASATRSIEQQGGLSIQATPPSSPRILSPSRPFSPREAVGSPVPPQHGSRPSTPRKVNLKSYEDTEIEYEDEEILDDGNSFETSLSLDLARAKQMSRRRRKHGKPGHGQYSENQRSSTTSSQVSVRGPESVTSMGSTASGSVGTAKHMPQRNHVLLIKRLMQAAGKGQEQSTPRSTKRLGSARR